MGREIRRVPIDWQHPRDTNGNYMPMFGETYEQALEDWRKYGAVPEDKPDAQMYCPVWPADTAMGYCVYENVSEGTPMSPVFETESEVIHWLIEQGYNQKAAQKFVRMGWAPSFVMGPQGLLDGIAAAEYIGRDE